MTTQPQSGLSGHDPSDRASQGSPAMEARTERLLAFRVRVGHEQLLVRGCDRADALREARRRLCLELPRMWDVIQGLDDSRFDVTPMPEGVESVESNDCGSNLT
ncbi:MAG: hypothetical protein KDB14_30915 [Planctomycetales bacterium]|nr:hypothetical protein [Planctomycetales bacterium]